MVRKKPGRKPEPPSKRGIAWPRWTGFRGKTIWDWLQLLIVPLALAVLGLWFTMQQDARQQQIETQRAEAERELAEQRAQDEALQAYLSQMSSLILEKDLRNSEEDSEVRTLARARTLTVLGRLDPSRKSAVVQFLAEAKLVQSVEGREPIAGLGGADLREANLSMSFLGSTDLSGASLSDADLSNAYLTGASLFGANLSLADLSNAYLGDARDVTDDQLAEARSLEDATMPDGQQYEDWLKSKGSGDGS